VDSLICPTIDAIALPPTGGWEFYRASRIAATRSNTAIGVRRPLPP
jgi:hypothetical protein